MALEEKKTVLLTFDVEDWFQVENFKEYIPFSHWDSYQLRVEKNTIRILDLLDSFPFKPKATFFVLGWIAKKVPGLVKEISARGHEVANHGNHHHLCTKQNFKEILGDLKTGKKILEDILGKSVDGYRAPSFAINNDILKVIEDAGHEYDSSFNSFGMHGRYGSIDAPITQGGKAYWKISPHFFELPVSNLSVHGKILPLGGGGYFRLIPFLFFKKGMDAVFKNQDLFVFYSHPWEFDPDQPRVEQASIGFKFRHYINLNRTEKKLTAMLNTFRHYNFISCGEYIGKIK